MNYIPLEKKRKSSFDIMDSSSKKKRRMKPITFGGDSRILPRIRQLMGIQVPHYLDEDQLLLDLKDAYPEYRRKKKGDLKSAIRKAVGFYATDGANSGEGGSGQSFVNDTEFCPDERYVAYENAKYSKKIYSGKRKERLEEKEIVITHSETTANDNDVNMHSPETCAKDGRVKLSRNSNQGLNTKDSKVQKSEQTPKFLKKLESKGLIPEYPTLTYCDIGGLHSTTLEISKLLLHFMFPEGFLPRAKNSCGILLHGPPGCGKTLLARAIAGEMQFPLIEVEATSLVSGISGETEEKIRNLFMTAVNNSPSILFIDEIDAITTKRESTSRGMEKRVVSQLLKCMDDLGTKHVNSKVLVIGATNNPNALDPAFRREGRFDDEIVIGIPDEAGRISILQVICKDLQLPPGFDIRWLAKHTPGYVGADLAAVVKGAIKEAVNRISQKLSLILESNSKVQSQFTYFMKKPRAQVNNFPEASEKFLSTIKADTKLRAILSVMKSDPEFLAGKLTEKFNIEIEDFQMALDRYVPCTKREGFASVPNTTWKDVGALKEVQKALQKAILWPVKYKEVCDKFKYTGSSGMLLWGPKGCGKTLLAKAIANECSINLLSVKGPELLNMYVGESERAVRQVFQKARNAAPCVILFDELDALCPPRSNSSGNASAERVVNQLLTEMDGMESRKQIFVLGTTNRLENIDSAMLRPGRLDEKVFVGLPTPKERVDILRTVTKNGTEPQLADDINLEALALSSCCDGLSGADLAALVMKASSKAVEDYFAHSVDGIKDSKAEVSLAHFHGALSEITPSVSKEERKYYAMMKLSEDRKG